MPWLLLIGQMVLELIRFSPIKYKRGAAVTAAAAGPQTGFSADDVGESSLKCSAEMTVEVSVLGLQATLPRLSTAPVSHAPSGCSLQPHCEFQREIW